MNTLLLQTVPRRVLSISFMPGPARSSRIVFQDKRITGLALNFMCEHASVEIYSLCLPDIILRTTGIITLFVHGHSEEKSFADNPILGPEDVCRLELAVRHFNLSFPNVTRCKIEESPQL